VQRREPAGEPRIQFDRDVPAGTRHALLDEAAGARTEFDDDRRAGPRYDRGGHLGQPRTARGNGTDAHRGTDELPEETHRA
jgi:hypothetical protein